MAEIGRYPESPPFRYVLEAGDLTVGGIYSKDYENTDCPEKKYAPFNLMTITNFSMQKLTVYIGDHIVKSVPPSAVVTLEVDAIWRWRIENNDTADNSDLIEIIVEKKLTEREILKLIAKKMGVIA
jgi:hypothetical protein